MKASTDFLGTTENREQLIAMGTLFILFAVFAFIVWLMTWFAGPTAPSIWYDWPIS